MLLQRSMTKNVEMDVRARLVDFVRRRDAFMDVCFCLYPLPPEMVFEICRQWASQLTLVLYRYDARTLRFFKTLRPSMRFPKRFPLMTFPGAVIYIRQFADAQFCCETLRNAEIRMLGMDTEWKPHRKGTNDDNPTALIQLCFRTPERMKRGCLELPVAQGAEYVCLLLHVIHHGVPPALKALLNDPAVHKIGVEISGDTEKLKRHYNMDIPSLIELYDEAKQKRRLNVRGLRSLFKATVGYDYPKDRSITLSNWERLPLSEQQQTYAACDAFAALRIYESLRQGCRH